jgi:MerR family transcriptional regulator, repressor of the yfmOP operon
VSSFVPPALAPDPPLLGIGAAARECGVSERALRYYQQIGLLSPSGRTPGGLRRYAPADLDRVRRIRELQTLLGLNLDEIRVVLENDDRLAKVREEYRSTRAGAARRRELLEEGLAIHDATAATIDAKLTGLQRYRTEVEETRQRVRALLAELDASPAGAR